MATKKFRSIEEIYKNEQETVRKLLVKFTEIAESQDDKVTLEDITKLRSRLRMASKVIGLGKLQIEASGWFCHEFLEQIREKNEEFFLDFDVDKHYSDYKLHGKSEEDYAMAKRLADSMKSAFLTLDAIEKKRLWLDVIQLCKNVLEYGHIHQYKKDHFPKFYKI